MQHVVLAVQQFCDQRVAVGVVVDDRVVAHVRDADRRFAVAERAFVRRMGVVHEVPEQAGGAAFRSRAQQPGDDGGVGAVARARGAEGPVEAHAEAYGPHEQIARQPGAFLREMVARLHGADGMGTGGAGAHLEQIKQGRIDAGRRHEAFLRAGLRPGCKPSPSVAGGENARP